MGTITYECADEDCEHTVTIHNDEEQPVFCGCDPNGHPMIPLVESSAE